MFTDHNRLRQRLDLVRLADLNQIQLRITALPQKFNHAVVGGEILVVNGIVTIRSGDFLRFAV